MTRFIEFASRAGPGAFVVERFSGVEALSQLPLYRLDLLSERDDLAADELLGSNATVAIERADGAPPRWFNGYLTQFVVCGQVRTPAFGGGPGIRYQATLRPALWFRTLSRRSRIFHDTSVGELLLAELRADGLQSVHARLAPTEPRECIVQYRESDADFLSRLAEHAGIHYCFSHVDGAHTMIVADHSPANPVNTLSARLRIGTPSPQGEITRFERFSAVRAGAVALHDCPAGEATAPLVATARQAAAHDNAHVEWADHPAGTTSPDWLARYARLRAEAFACRQVIVRGAGTARDLLVGSRTHFEGHALPDLDGDYLVTAHRFEARNNLVAGARARGAAFDCTFEAIPAEVPFRPPRRTPWPSIAGTQPARVVAEARDDHPPPSPARADRASTAASACARVKVAFYWEREGRPSCWARVAQLWAGAGHGLQSLPRRGEEVLVQFVDGRPECPVVCGRLHNAEQPPPYALPAGAAITGLKTLSVDAAGRGIAGHFNELRFDDRAGAEQVVLRAQRDLLQRVLHDQRIGIDGESHRVVHRDALDACHSDRHLSTAGDRREAVGGCASLAAAQDIHLQSSHGRVAIGAAGEIHLAAGVQLVLEADARLTLKVGPSFIDINPAGIFLVGPQVRINRGGRPASGQGAAPQAPRTARASTDGEGGVPVRVALPHRPPATEAAQASSVRFAAQAGMPFVGVCGACAPCCGPAGACATGAAPAAAAPPFGP